VRGWPLGWPGGVLGEGAAHGVVGAGPEAVLVGLDEGAAKGVEGYRGGVALGQTRRVAPRVARPPGPPVAHRATDNQE
jgi:hypothetical protein